MTGSEQGKNQQRSRLDRQHLDEWNAQLAQEMRARIALEDQHKQEHSRSYLEEINFHDRTLLEARQRQAVNELAQQNRAARIKVLKRHTQENDALNDQSNRQSDGPPVI